MLEVIERMGTVVKVRLHDATGERRGKPDGVAGARIYSHIGPTAPVNVVDWKFEGQVTRTAEIPITFASETAPGTIVWFTACWYNPRGETGPGCAPVSTNIAGGEMEMAA